MDAAALRGRIAPADSFLRATAGGRLMSADRNRPELRGGGVAAGPLGEQDPHARRHGWRVRRWGDGGARTGAVVLADLSGHCGASTGCSRRTASATAWEGTTCSR